MPSLHEHIHNALRDALTTALGPEHADADPLLRPTNNPKHGDYQANLAMALAKKLGRKPRDIAEPIAAALLADATDLIADAQVAGPGFINLTLQPAALNAAVTTALSNDRLGLPTTDAPQRVVIDYASPNLAKEMHIGHLRSTIIGDALARVLRFRGDTVLAQNHIGDWGTQFGMLLEHLLDTGWDAQGDHSISDLNALYQAAKQRDDTDPDFAKRARERVVALQAGDPDARALWRQLIDESVEHMNQVFAQLGVLLNDDDLAPESMYNDQLANTCADLQALGVATESNGALVGFVEGEEAPLIIRKSDGGFGYGTTDLAAIRYRVDTLHADRLVYVVDARQRDHFHKAFALAHKAEWTGDTTPEHVAFGTILGTNNKPFATRDGGTVKLTDVLTDAVNRAATLVADKNPDLTGDEQRAVAQAVGIGAVKYADLSNDRIKDYVFDWDRMLSFEGNTAPYLLNACVRIASIFRKGNVNPADLDCAAVAITEPAERALVLLIAQFGGTIDSVADSLEPHRLCTYLYDLASAFHKFYEACPVLKDDVPPDTRASRLALCAATAHTLRTGLNLLGLRTIDRM